MDAWRPAWLQDASGNLQPHYILTTQAEFEAKSGAKAPAGKRYFSHTSLPDIVSAYPFKQVSRCGAWGRVRGRRQKPSTAAPIHTFLPAPRCLVPAWRLRRSAPLLLLLLLLHPCTRAGRRGLCGAALRRRRQRARRARVRRRRQNLLPVGWVW